MTPATLRSSLLLLLGVAACGGFAPKRAAYTAQDSAVMAPPPSYESTAGESYTAIRENGVVAVADAPRSTFAIDVDTASMSNIRRFLEGSTMPPKDSVRIEEMVNYFDYAYADPEQGPFAVITEVGPSPFHAGQRLVHVGLQGKRMAAKDLPPRNLVFLVDTSGSMEDANKLPLLKQGLKLLVEQLGSDDRVGIVAYAGSAGVVLEPTSDKDAILASLGGLQSGGSTAGGEGIVAAYALAHQHFDRRAINRVILATDGDFNVGVTDEEQLVQLIDREKRGGVFLTVLGLGTGNLKDSRMEKLADHGNGNYAYIDSLAEARKVLVEEAGGTLVTIAQDVKVQVEFDPAQVTSYRLVGYENRLLAEQDFRDDGKDAGELGAGHSVTAIYEIVPAPQARRDAAIATVRLRWQPPGGGEATEIAVPAVERGAALRDTSDDFRFAAAVAGFGMLLRGSEQTGDATWAGMRDLARTASAGDARRVQLVGLIETAARLAGSPLGGATVAR